MKNRRKTALAIRLHVDEHMQTHWEIYERASEAVFLRRRTCPLPGKHGNSQLSNLLADIQAVAT